MRRGPRSGVGPPAGGIAIIVALLLALMGVAPATAHAQDEPCGQPVILPANTFLSCWDTRNLSANSSSDRTIALPLVAGGVYDFEVNWGDGTTSIVKNLDDTGIGHTYATPGQYWIAITGTIEGFAFNGGGDRLKLIDVAQWGPLALGDTGGYFQGAANVNPRATDAPDLLATTTLARAFKDATVFNSPIGGWDTSNVTSLEETFAGAAAFNQPLDSWDTAKVTTLRRTFAGADAFNQPLDSWDTAKVTTLRRTFDGASAFNQDLGSWLPNGNAVTDLQETFSFATSFNGDVSGWDTRNVTSLQGTFSEATSFNGDISGWDTSKVENLDVTFRGAQQFNRNLSGWNTGQVTSMSATFQGASRFRNGGQPLTWNTAKVTDFRQTFSRATLFNQPLDSWDTSSAVTMESMFAEARSFNQDLSGWNLESVTNTGDMFFDAESFDNGGQPLTWDVGAVTTMASMFEDAISFTRDIGGWNITSVTTMANMFNGVTLPTGVYDAILNGWAAQPVQANVAFNAGTSKYSVNGQAARDSLIADDTWTITDGGLTALVPGAPTGVSATASSGAAEVSWTAPAFDGGEPITLYTVTATPGAHTCTTDGALACTVTGLTNATPYTFTVTATNIIGSSPPSTPSAPVTPVGPVNPNPPPVFPPSPPIDVEAQPLVAGAMVTWQPPVFSGSFPVTSYQVRTVPASPGCLVSAPVTSCVLGGLESGEVYTVQVRALNGAGWGSWSIASDPITPLDPVVASMMITGSRHNRFIAVTGETTGMVGAVVRPVVALGDRPAQLGRSSVVVQPDGGFGWQRRTSREVTVHFRGDGVESNRITIRPRPRR